jgi:hypothetical protein
MRSPVVRNFRGHRRPERTHLAPRFLGQLNPALLEHQLGIDQVHFLIERAL